MGEANTDCHEHWALPARNRETARSEMSRAPPRSSAWPSPAKATSTRRPIRPAPGGDWRVADIDGDGRDTHLLGVSCPTASLCAAVSGERYTAGKVLTSTDPTGGASARRGAGNAGPGDLRASRAPRKRSAWPATPAATC